MYFINKTRKAQTLLIVVVVTSLALLIVLGISDRIMLSQYNIQRDLEFDRALVVAENRINEIKGILSKRNDLAVSQCLSVIDNSQRSSGFVDMLNINSCQFLRDRLVDFERRNLNVFARRIDNSSVNVSVGNTLTLKLTDNINQGIQTKNIRISCANNVNVPVVVTRVFLNPQGHLLVDKGFVQNCNNNMTNVIFYSNNGQEVPNTTFRENTVYVSVRALSGQASIRLEIYNQQDRIVSTTDKYEFIVTGVGGELGELGVGSDIPVKFELGAGRTYITNEFLDYAFFERQ